MLSWLTSSALAEIQLGYLGAFNTGLVSAYYGDIATAAQPYEPQPYKTVSVDGNLFDGGHRVYGLSYDAEHQILYGYEGAYLLPTIVHAWAVTPEPMSLLLLAAGLGWAGAVARRNVFLGQQTRTNRS